MAIIFIALLLAIITGLAYGSYNISGCKNLRAHINKEQFKESPYEDAKMRYFYECARKYLLRKYPTMVSFEISSGNYSATVHSSTIGFKVYLEDGSVQRCLQNTEDIFFREHVDQEDIDEFVKDAEYEYLKEHLQVILSEVEMAKLDQKLGVDYDISELEEEQIKKLQDLLLDEGIQSIIDEKEKTILKVVVVSDSIA